MPTELAKAYDPRQVEEKWYAYWKAIGCFHAVPEPGKPNYSITIPPPNITGSLHMGHALNNTILDAMTRWHRMRGFCALCLPGTDHAGIATQAVVERELAKEGKTRQELGREAFIARCWEWREQYGTRIYHQFERLGCSFDWDRVRFTLDESYVEAIMEEFRSWYERGLIYRGVRVVNWDVKFQSSVSDIEVNMETRAGKLYHLRYPFADGSGSVTIATTRPETLLGDTAVAANPDDARYQPLFGKLLRLPLTDREIPLIADEYAKPEFGSGAVKVTPAHDLNDFECGQRHGLPQIIVIGKDGRMTEAAGPDYAGLDRFEARKRVLADMEALGLLEKVEDYTIQLPISDRSKEVIEPLLSEEWFVDMRPLARPAIDAVKEGRIRFYPDRFKDIYLYWMENIRDWNISRQLWWGHRIPLWWTDDPAATGGKLEPSGRRHAFARTREQAVAALGTEACWQDEDVLDTWFSSALWPHATLGWPEQTEDLAAFYPTSLLSTAQEILYLWVARMIMTGLDFVGDIPFRDVYIHATVLDAKGERMSKSKGNGIDPLDLIDKYGADATRLSLMQQAGKNQDIRYSEQRTEIAANFCNKLWNASRFVLMNLEDRDEATAEHTDPPITPIQTTGNQLPATSHQLPSASYQPPATIADRWILSRLNATAAAVSSALASYDMDDATRALYEFFWNEFCDWYVEMAKPRLRGDTGERAAARQMLAGVLDQTLRLLHPILPFITEEIWQALEATAGSPIRSRMARQPGTGPQASTIGVSPAIHPPSSDKEPATTNHQPAASYQLPAATISLAPYPEARAELDDPAAEAQMATVIEATRALRNLRAELGIAPGARLQAMAVAMPGAAREALAENAALIAELARLAALSVSDSPPSAGSGKWVATPIAGAEVFLEIGDALDTEKEIARIDKELAEIEKQVARAGGMLANPAFTERAPADKVQQERDRLATWQEKEVRLRERRAIFER
ncbi:MAG TPA: valine--tRNA ligase [Chthonomonadaceae bacterium]|nr:valine--tRNA ligase [Chthonomonadaceae bacterium]